MIISAFFYTLAFCLVSLALCGLGYLIIFIFQSEQMADSFFLSWVFYFNGILVGGTGYGLMWYIIKDGKNLLALLNNVIDLSNQRNYNVVVYSRKANSWLWRNIVGIPITILGGIILLKSGYPHEGLAKYYLAICSISIYYVASYIFVFFIFVLFMFKSLEENLSENLTLKSASPIAFDTLNNFFTVTSTIGIVAIYFGFRGTLTANLEIFEAGETLRRIFIIPVILFLPVTLFYSFYPRYVIKKIYDIEIINKIKKLEQIKSDSIKESEVTIDQLNIEKTLTEIKEKLLAERKQMPIINLKDSPSLALVFLMLLQLIVQYDKVVNDFFKIF